MPEPHYDEDCYLEERYGDDEMTKEQQEVIDFNCNFRAEHYVDKWLDEQYFPKNEEDLLKFSKYVTGCVMMIYEFPLQPTPDQKRIAELEKEIDKLKKTYKKQRNKRIDELQKENAELKDLLNRSNLRLAETQIENATLQDKILTKNGTILFLKKQLEEKIENIKTYEKAAEIQYEGLIEYYENKEKK